MTVGAGECCDGGRFGGRRRAVPGLVDALFLDNTVAVVHSCGGIRGGCVAIGEGTSVHTRFLILPALTVCLAIILVIGVGL